MKHRFLVLAATIATIALMALGCSAPSSSDPTSGGDPSAAIGSTQQATLSGVLLTPDLSSAEFTTIQAYAYNATTHVFNNGTSDCYMWIEGSTTDSTAHWTDAPTNSVSSEVPTYIETQAATIINGGTYISSTHLVSYNAHTYNFQLFRDTSNQLWMRAHQVT